MTIDQITNTTEANKYITAMPSDAQLLQYNRRLTKTELANSSEIKTITPNESYFRSKKTTYTANQQ